MVYEPFDDAQLEAWRELLEQFADDSDLDRQLIDLLLIVRLEPLRSAEREKAIAQIVMLLDEGLIYKSQNRSISRLSVKMIQQLQKELDRKKAQLSKQEFEKQQQIINSLSQELAEQQELLIDWLLEHIHEFAPDFKDKNGDYIGRNIAEKLCYWIYKKLLERFADDSDLDEQLIDLLVIARPEPLRSAEREKAIAQIVMLLDEGLIYKSQNRSINRLSVKMIQQLQKELDRKKAQLSKQEFEKQQQIINSLSQELAEQQELLIDWLLEHIHEFAPDFKDKNGDYIGKNIAEKLCHWINKKLRFLRKDAEKERRKENAKLTLDEEDDESGRTNLDKYFQNFEDLNQWSNEEAEVRLDGFWKYLNEDPNNQLRNHEYRNGLNYHKFVQRLYQIFTLLLKEHERKKDEKTGNSSDKMSERVIISIIDQIAEEFGISTAALRSEYNRNFKDFVAGLWIDMIIDNEEYLEVLMAAIAEDRLKLLQEVYYKKYQDVNVQYLTKQGALRYKTPLDFNSIAAELKRQGMKPRDATAPMIFDFWQKRAKPAIANLVIKEKLFGSLGL